MLFLNNTQIHAKIKPHGNLYFHFIDQVQYYFKNGNKKYSFPQIYLFQLFSFRNSKFQSTVLNGKILHPIFFLRNLVENRISWRKTLGFSLVTSLLLGVDKQWLTELCLQYTDVSDIAKCFVHFNFPFINKGQSASVILELSIK